MATLQSDFSDAFLAVFQGGDFDSFLGGAGATIHAEAGFLPQSYRGQYGRMLVVPQAPMPNFDAVYDDSAQTVYPFRLVGDLFNRTDAKLTVANLLQVMVSKFADRGTTFSAQVTDTNSDLNETSVQLQIVASVITDAEAIPELQTGGASNQARKVALMEVEVKCWHDVPLT